MISAHAIQVLSAVRWYTDAMKPQHIRSKDVPISKHLRLCLSTTTPNDNRPSLVEPGNHVWPFLFDLDALPAESVEGLGDTHVTYYVKATVVTAGYLTKNISTTTQLRVVRVLENGASESFDPDQTECGVWQDQLHYHITASPQWHHWGCPIALKFKFQPFTKGISIERIVARLHEEIRLRAPTQHRNLFYRSESVVAGVEASSANDSAMLLDDAANVSDGHRFEVEVPLPQSLKACRQSVVQDRIQITHLLKMELYIRNRFGEVCIQFPYHFVFPHGIIFDSKDVAGLPSSLQRAVQDVQEAFSTPPAFGEHYSDPMYRPGLLVRKVEGHRELLVHTYQGEVDCYTPLRTTQTSRFVLSTESPKLHYPADFTKFMCLDRVPSYNTALRTPEIYTDVTDRRPAYMAR
ncbi:carbon catabolite repression protein [Stagonosporopsis vannaccii]|nr:carbon catabolite repression protein [Stagonosporopsis vannaccii]